jgi:hypothetical protein
MLICVVRFREVPSEQGFEIGAIPVRHHDAGAFQFHRIVAFEKIDDLLVGRARGQRANRGAGFTLHLRCFL